MIITNEQQYKITRAHAERFAESLRAVESAPPAEANDAELRAVYVAGLRSQLDELREQIAHYEAVRHGRVAELRLRSLADLPDVLLAARIAAGLTQRELAERLGVREQQIQHDEATHYAGASWERLVTVAALLGVSFEVCATLPERGSLATAPTTDEFIRGSV